ncbi:hypothetical protein RND81_04G075800 [Saponaria officinalis]|uniref:FH2 domain-containing protein n=1 Tax=Saponaria officinalis TaxID=3572 RepID=A0AAW1LJ92_SAPOF
MIKPQFYKFTKWVFFIRVFVDSRLYLAQNYDVPNIKKLGDTGLAMLKNIEDTYRKPKKRGRNWAEDSEEDIGDVENIRRGDLRKNLQTVNSISEEIRTSTKMERVMQTILSLGNALNQGTARVVAMRALKDSLRVPDRMGWNGDPCAPTTWDAWDEKDDDQE